MNKKLKYALLFFWGANLGDNAQVYALYNIYKYMGISDEDIVLLSRFNVEEKAADGSTFIVPICSAMMVNFDFVRFTIEKKIDNQFIFIPVSLGLLRIGILNEQNLNKFKDCLNRFITPIGCRDSDTAEILRNAGYPCYVNGCITNILPKRDNNKVYDKVYFIDIPNRLFEYIPQEIKENAIELRQEESPPDYYTEEDYYYAVQRYELLRDTAKLVITNRYHIAIPCVAMGIPVIMCCDNILTRLHYGVDIRLTDLNPYIPYYTKEQYSHIDWNPQPVDFEDTKLQMLNLIVSRFKSAEEIYYSGNKLNDFFKPNREKFSDIINTNKYDFENNVIINVLKPMLSHLIAPCKYYIYGLSEKYIESKYCLFLDVLQKNFPNYEFLGFVDSFKTGEAFGKPIIHPDDMNIDEHSGVIVGAYSANKYVKKLFEEKGWNKTHLYLMGADIMFHVYQL